MSRRILLHYYHAGSLGHGQRVMALAGAIKARAPDADVVVAAGGVPIPEQQPPVGVEWIQLPALTSSAEPTFELRPANLSLPLEEVMRLRRDLLFALVRRLRPHALVTDLFPFGRQFLCAELLPLCHLLKRRDPKTRLVCSMRDLLGQPKHVYTAAAARSAGRLLSRLFHAVLVHGDPGMHAVEEELSRGGALPRHVLEQVIYTGYVTAVGRQELPNRSRLRARLGVGKAALVVVSAGGGADGVQLLEAAARAEALLNRGGPACRVLLHAGPFFPGADMRRLARRASARPLLELESYSPGLVALINAADVSVSMGGYNTCAELLLTGTPAVIVPRTSWEQEQLIRASALQARGWARVLEPGDLTPGTLAAAISQTLGAAPRRRRRPDVRVDGADFSARYLLR